MLDRPVQTQIDAGTVAELDGLPPVAPLAMPKQVLERAPRVSLIQRLARLFTALAPRPGQ